jgi:hypothetical protein
MSEVTEPMLHAAAQKAVELGLLPKHVFPDVQVDYYEKLRAVIQAALNAQ